MATEEKFVNPLYCDLFLPALQELREKEKVRNLKIATIENILIGFLV